jgi:hypothetical protein
MSWQERFQELARKKRKEFNENQEYKKQILKKDERVVQRIGPVIEEVARVLEYQIYKDPDGWRLDPGFGMQYVTISFYGCPNEINIRRTYREAWGDGHYGHIETVDVRDIEDKTLNDRLRNAIAKCV